MGQAYDDLGFPIPAEFEVPGTSGTQRLATRQRPGPVKRWVVIVVALGLVLPAVVVPALVPLAKQVVGRWSLERAFACEARNDVAGAVREMGRAVAWFGEDATLLAARAMLRLESGDQPGAAADADRAVALAPARIEPYRVRAIVHVCRGRAEAALADVAMVVDLAGEENAEAVNLRAYVRGLVGQEIPEALADIERVVAAMPAPSPEVLDTRGFLRHLAGQSVEALADLEEAIALTQLRRQQMVVVSGRIDRLDLLQRMRTLDHSLAVMLHHRGLIFEAVGEVERAQADFELARRKGFAPERGIL